MYWAVTAQSSNVVANHGFRLSTVGVILMIAGAIGFIVSFLVFMASRRSTTITTGSVTTGSVTREPKGTAGDVIVHDVQR